MTDHRNSTTADASTDLFGKHVASGTPRQPDVSAEPTFHDGRPCVRAVYTAVADHLRRPPRVFDLGRAVEPRPHDSPSGPVPSRFDGIDLVLCLAADACAREPLLEAVVGAADTAGAVLFESIFDYWTAGRHDEPSDAFVRLRRDFAFVHTIGEYDAGDERHTVIFCSNRYWYVDGRLDTFNSWVADSHKIAERIRRGTRRYFFSADTIIKNYCFYGLPALENRRDIEREVLFLSRPPIENRRLPRLIAYHIGARNGVTVTERLPGIPLSAVLQDGKNYDPAAVLRGVLDFLDALERAGLYHNDLEQNNVLIDGSDGAFPIDFASIGPGRRRTSRPYSTTLQFFLFAQTVIQKQFQSFAVLPFPLRPFRFPRRYRRWAALVWTHPASRRNFALIRACLETAIADHPLSRRRSGLAGRIVRSYRRFVYRRALFALQMSLFMERIKTVTARGIVRRITGLLSWSVSIQPTEST